MDLLYFSLFHVLRILMSLMFSHPQPTSWEHTKHHGFLCWITRVDYFFKKHQQKGHEGKEDLGGYSEKILISSPGRAAASLGMAHGWATALQIEASIGNTLANYSSSCYQLLKHWLFNCYPAYKILLGHGSKATLLQNIPGFGQPSCVS